MDNSESNQNITRPTTSSCHNERVDCFDQLLITNILSGNCMSACVEFIAEYRYHEIEQLENSLASLLTQPIR